MRLAAFSRKPTWIHMLSLDYTLSTEGQHAVRHRGAGCDQVGVGLLRKTSFVELVAVSLQLFLPSTLHFDARHCDIDIASLLSLV